MNEVGAFPYFYKVGVGLDFQRQESFRWASKRQLDLIVERNWILKAFKNDSFVSRLIIYSKLILCSPWFFSKMEELLYAVSFRFQIFCKQDFITVKSSSSLRFPFKIFLFSFIPCVLNKVAHIYVIWWVLHSLIMKKHKI